MPISEELLKQMSAIPESDIDDDSLKKLEGKPIHQQIFNRGHASSTGTSKQKVEDAEKNLKTAQDALAKLQGEFDEYKKTTPNVAAVDAQYKDQITKLEKEIADLKESAKTSKIESKRQSMIARTREILAETVDPVYAESLVDRDSIRSRISSENGEIGKILQPDKQIPYAGDDEAQAKALATELAKGVPAKYLRTDLPKGTGSGATGGIAGTDKKAKFDAVRDKVQKKKGDGTVVDPQANLNKALGKTARV